MRTVGRILLAAVTADLVGTGLFLIWIAFGESQNPTSFYVGGAGLVMSYGMVFALPAAIAGVLLGDRIAPARGFWRGTVL